MYRRTRSTTRTKRTATWNRQNRRWTASSRMKSWTPQEINTLKKFYRTNSNDFIAKKLHRSEGSVQYKASSLGLRKSPAYLKQIRNNWN